MAKPVLAIDIDEVLFPFLPELLKYYNRLQGTKFKLEDHLTYNFGDTWGTTEAEAMVHVNAFLRLDQRKTGPMPGALEALGRLKERFRLVIVTSRDNAFEHQTKEWLLHHFPADFDRIIMVGNHHTGKAFRTKVELCQELGAVALIDDSLPYVIGCAEQGVPALLFGDYPWNQTDKLLNGVVRVRDWREAEQVLREKVG